MSDIYWRYSIGLLLCIFCVISIGKVFDTLFNDSDKATPDEIAENVVLQKYSALFEKSDFIGTAASLAKSLMEITTNKNAIFIMEQRKEKRAESITFTEETEEKRENKKMPQRRRKRKNSENKKMQDTPVLNIETDNSAISKISDIDATFSSNEGGIEIMKENICEETKKNIEDKIENTENIHVEEKKIENPVIIQEDSQKHEEDSQKHEEDLLKSQYSIYRTPYPKTTALQYPTHYQYIKKNYTQVKPIPKYSPMVHYRIKQKSPTDKKEELIKNIENPLEQGNESEKNAFSKPDKKEENKLPDNSLGKIEVEEEKTKELKKILLDAAHPEETAPIPENFPKKNTSPLQEESQDTENNEHDPQKMEGDLYKNYDPFSALDINFSQYNINTTAPPPGLAEEPVLDKEKEDLMAAFKSARTVFGYRSYFSDVHPLLRNNNNESTLSELRDNSIEYDPILHGKPLDQIKEEKKLND